MTVSCHFGPLTSAKPFSSRIHQRGGKFDPVLPAGSTQGRGAIDIALVCERPSRRAKSRDRGDTKCTRDLCRRVQFAHDLETVGVVLRQQVDLAGRRDPRRGKAGPKQAGFSRQGVREPRRRGRVRSLCARRHGPAGCRPPGCAQPCSPRPGARARGSKGPGRGPGSSL